MFLEFTLTMKLQFLIYTQKHIPDNTDFDT